MDLKAEIECACCRKLVTASASCTSSNEVSQGFVTPSASPTPAFVTPSASCTHAGERINTVRVGLDAKVHCKSCVESTQISRKKAMNFKRDEREVVIVTQDGSNLYADSLILSSKSEVFEKMFEAEMLEKQTRKVTIDDVKTETVFDFLVFLYQCELREIPSGEGLKELLQLARRFDVKELVHVLDRYIVSELVNTPLDLELMKLGLIYDLPKTKQFLRQNATQEIMGKVCGSLGEDCPWDVEYFKTVLASPNITWKQN